MDPKTNVPLIFQAYEFFTVLMPWADFLVLLKIFQFALIYSVFEYHKLVSLKPEFQSLYPVLFSKLDKKTYNNFKWFYATLPIADWYFFYRLWKQKNNTVAFMKDYGVKKCLYDSPKRRAR